MSTLEFRDRCEPCPRRTLQLPPEMIGQEACVSRLRAEIAAVGSRKGCTVLIQGESGTGKELVARHIHAATPCRTGPFVAVDCTTLRDTLFESQLFGHVKGAFTGADSSTLGMFRAADGGTLFLDEVGELQPPIQAKLLRCIQDGAVVPLGAVEPIAVDVRIVAATHRDLQALVRRGEFRQDLFFRLAVVRMQVPPLRDRRSDISPLAEYHLSRLAETYQEPLKTISAEAHVALQRHDWPGNVRELMNVIEHAFVFSANTVLGIDDLPKALRTARKRTPARTARKIVPLQTAERCLIKRALLATGGNQVLAGRLLGVERHRLARMIQRHGLQPFTRNVRS